MKYIFYGILAVLFALYWFYFKRVKEPPYKFILKFGKPGAFKTTDMCYNAIKYQLQGWNVYCNVPIQVDGVRYYKTENFGDFWVEDNSVIMIDELNLQFDNRSFATLKKSVIRYTRLYRHNRVIIIGYSQAGDIDAKLKRICNEVWIMKKLSPVLSYQRQISKAIILSNNSAEGDVENDLVDNMMYVPWTSPGAIKIIYMEPYFKYHDSYSRPEGIKLMPFKTIFNDDQQEFRKKVNKKLVEQALERAYAQRKNKGKKEPLAQKRKKKKRKLSKKSFLVKRSS